LLQSVIKIAYITSSISKEHPSNHNASSQEKAERVGMG
jgi:hypothetical protein